MAWGEWKTKKILILGTEYTVELSSDEEKYTTLKKADGFIDTTVKLIVVRDDFSADSDSMKNLDVVIKKNIRHEVIHGFLYESGLDWDTHKANSWAVEEEMIDFFALQYPKILEVFTQLNCI